MAWIESESPSFRARHDSIHADDADRVLYSLERTREYLGQYFPDTLAGISVVFHPCARRVVVENNADMPGRLTALVGGTVIDLLVSERGEQAAAHLATRLHPHGPRGALREAFRGRPTTEVEGAWRAHLARMAAAG